MFIINWLEKFSCTIFTWLSEWARAHRAGTSAVTSCRTSQSPSSRCQCVSLSLSLSLSAGSDPRTVLKTASLLHAHRSNVHYCYYSSLVNQRSRDQTISHHTRWKLEQLNICWVTQTYSTTFSYFGDECMEGFFHCIADAVSSWRYFFFLVLYKDTTTFVGMRGREWLEAKREICWRMHWSGFKWRFLLSACVQQQTKKKKDEDGNYHFLRSFRQEG